MKKSIFSFAVMAIAAMATVVLSSCDKNDDGYGQKAKPQVSTTTATPAPTPTMATAAKLSVISYGVSDDLAKLGTFTLVVTDGSKTAEYDIAAQGKHTTMQVAGKNFSGYVIAVSQPYSASLKASVKYTSNGSAKSLTNKDKLDLYGVKFIGAVTDPSAKIDHKLVGYGVYDGAYAEEGAEGVVTLLNGIFQK